MKVQTPKNSWNQGFKYHKKFLSSPFQISLFHQGEATGLFPLNCEGLMPRAITMIRLAKIHMKLLDLIWNHMAKRRTINNINILFILCLVLF
jgi:hypothetical protein